MSENHDNHKLISNLNNGDDTGLTFNISEFSEIPDNSGVDDGLAANMSDCIDVSNNCSWNDGLTTSISKILGMPNHGNGNKISTANISECLEVTNNVNGENGLPVNTSECPQYGNRVNGFFVNLLASDESNNPPAFDTNLDNNTSKQDQGLHESLPFQSRPIPFYSDKASISLGHDIPDISENPLPLSGVSEMELMNDSPVNERSVDVSNISQMETDMNANPAPVTTQYVPSCLPPECGPSYMTFPANAYVQNPSNFLGFDEPGGLLEVEARALATMEQVDPNSTWWNTPIFSNSLMDWGIPQHIMQQLPNPKCQSCPLIRRLIHSNGVVESKLEIHGLEAQPRHAVWQCRPCFDNGQRSNHIYKRIEFPIFENANYINEFIAHHNRLRRNEGSVLRHDSLMINGDMAPGVGATKQTGLGIGNPYTSGQYQNKQFNNGFAASSSTQIPKSSYAAQRQRTSNLQIEELSPYFHLPINEAAKYLQLCPTVMKKICRRNGMTRWPYRKIKSIERQICLLEQKIAKGEVNEYNRTQLAALRNELAMLYKGSGGYSR